MNIHFVSLGCPRNLVDSEIMIGRLLEGGHALVSDEGEADCVVVNTCSFIEPATSESVDVILEMGNWKKQRQGRRLIVVGCLAQRYGLDLSETLPEVDTFLGTGAFHRIVGAVEGSMGDERMALPPPAAIPVQDLSLPRFLTTPAHTAYLKISEGCSGRCTYCIIPTLRGPQKSRPMGEILDEAGALAAQGVKELVLVGQDTMAYGEDLGRRGHLKALLEALTRIPDLFWVRILYGHPDRATESLIETIASNAGICSYLDIPVQHISEPILRAMGRRHDSRAIFKLFERIRATVPGISLRTTVMVGFPGESDDDFERLLDFVETIRFDHLGAFVYSDNPDLPASALKGQVSGAVKLERFDRLMSRQLEISSDLNRNRIGKTFPVLVDGFSEEHEAVLTGRTYFQAPEIDGVVTVHEGEVTPGTLINVLITDAGEYDLEGKIV
jgi:ribosomal protein S12 methylthiotransferase